MKGWLKVFIKNKGNYEITWKGKSTFVVFYETGHALYISNPYGLPEKVLKKMRPTWIQQTCLLGFCLAFKAYQLLLPMPKS